MVAYECRRNHCVLSLTAIHPFISADQLARGQTVRQPTEDWSVNWSAAVPARWAAARRAAARLACGRGVAADRDGLQRRKDRRARRHEQRASLASAEQPGGFLLEWLRLPSQQHRYRVAVERDVGDSQPAAGGHLRANGTGIGEGPRHCVAEEKAARPSAERLGQCTTVRRCYYTPMLTLTLCQLWFVS